MSKKEPIIKRVKAASLVLDFNLYPRGTVDSQRVGYLVEALIAGDKLPPVIADSKSKRVIDGFHRDKAAIRFEGEDAEIDVEFRYYKNEAEMLLEAAELNARHGKPLDRHDRVHFFLLAKQQGISLDKVATALHTTPEKLEQLLDKRVAKSAKGGKGEPVALKRTIEHMAGKTLTAGQQTANKSLGGMTQVFIFNQAIRLLEEDLVNVANPHVIAAIDRLKLALKKFHAKNQKI